MEYPSKLECLPIEKKDYGFVQRATYHQPDLYHEEVVEVDGPFATIVSSGTEVITFLVLGDQNAGKSTFLHAFSFSGDPNFLQITALLPILSATFMNTRFLIDSKKPPRDELPFLDTDIARGTFLLTLEDFFFFLNENAIPLLQFKADTRFVLVQFIEIGGDHLDLLMHPHTVSPHVADVVNRTKTLLSESKKAVYFANCAELFSQTSSTHATLHPQAFEKLLERMRFLNATMPAGYEVQMYLSRLPNSSAFTHDSLKQSAESLSTRYGVHVPQIALSSPTELLSRSLSLISQKEHWSVKVVHILEAHHLNTDGTLNAEAIVATLARLFQHQMAHSSSGVESFVVHHLVKCYRNVKLRLDQYDQLTLFMNAETFSEYLEHAHNVEVPEVILLKNFAPVAQKLVGSGICVRQRGASQFSDMRVRFLTTPPLEWAPVVTSENSSAHIEIRFPLFAPLFDMLTSFFSRNVPGEFWLGQSYDLTPDKNLCTELIAVLAQLQNEIHALWESAVASNFADKSALTRLFLLLEDWRCGATVLHLPMHFPVQLSLHKLTLDRVREALHLHPAPAAYDIQDASGTVSLTLS